MLGDLCVAALDAVYEKRRLTVYGMLAHLPRWLCPQGGHQPESRTDTLSPAIGAYGTAPRPEEPNWPRHSLHNMKSRCNPLGQKRRMRRRQWQN